MSGMFGVLNMFALFAGMLWLGIQRVWGGFSAKDYFLTAKISVVASIVFSLLIKEENWAIPYFSANVSSIWTFVLTAGVVYLWLVLSLKWFVVEDLPVCLFCFLSLAALLCCHTIASTVNFGVLFGAMAVLALINYLFLYLSQQTEELHNISSRYGLSVLFFIFLAALSLYFLTPENWDLQHSAGAAAAAGTLKTYFILAGILFIFLFMLAVAPLHFWFTDTIAPAVLPVAFYFSLVPQISLWTAFIKVNLQVLRPLMDNLDAMYLVLGVLSVFVGAIGANTSRNLKKIFACSGIYNLGVMLLTTASFTDKSVFAGLVYMQVYILALAGIYTVFYGFKSRGDYLYNLNMIGGFAKVRPFAAGALLFFMASLAGLAPLPGFWGIWAAMGGFAHTARFGLTAVVLGGMLLLIPAYLQVVRAVCFSKKNTNFDRTENSIYAILVFLTVLILLLVCRPQLLDIQMQWAALAG